MEENSKLWLICHNTNALLVFGVCNSENAITICDLTIYDDYRYFYLQKLVVETFLKNGK